MGSSEPSFPRSHLLAGQVIPAHPLALDEHRRLDEQHQRALTRYYVAAGAGGIAVGVHTTQFEIRDPRHGLLAPVLELASRTADEAIAGTAGGPPRDFVKIAGILGPTDQALSEARLARDLGYHAGLLGFGGVGNVSDAELLRHCRDVAQAIPIVGFYLQPAVGGRVLGYGFWRALAELPELLGIKIAPFDRYHTLDVVRAVADSGRRDVALYTGNDDNIVADLLTRFPRAVGEKGNTSRTGGEKGNKSRAGSPGASGFADAPTSARDIDSDGPRIVGGLLGHWAVWTCRAVELLADVAAVRDQPMLDAQWLARGAAITDANGAIFDSRNAFAGCIAGIHEVLRRQGLMRGTWCLDPTGRLSPGQREEIDRVIAAYPWMTDNAFVAEHLDEWLH